MSEKSAKVIRKITKEATKVTGENVYKTYVGFIQSLKDLPFKRRVKFAYCIVFKRPWK